MNAAPLMWRVADGNKLVLTKPSAMRLEAHVEDLIETDPSCLGEPLLIIERQLFDRVDLLAIDASGKIHVIELKRGESSRETIAQAIEYLAWVEKLSTDEILAIFAHYRPGVDLAKAFFEHFGCQLPAVLNQDHVITIVAATVDPKTEGSVGAMQRRGFPITLFGYRYYQDLNAIQFVPYPHTDQNHELLLATMGRREPGPTRAVSAGELSRWHATLDHVGTSLEEFRPILETLRRPSSAATAYGPVAGIRGVDQYIFHFWLTYVWRFAWDFVPFSFLYELYQHWLRTQAVEGLHLEVLDSPVFGRRLAAVATATGEWSYARRRPEDLMNAPEPLTALVPAWNRPEADQNVHGYLRTGIAMRRGTGQPT